MNPPEFETVASRFGLRTPVFAVSLRVVDLRHLVVRTALTSRARDEMADVILQIGASKLAMSIGLAGLALTVGRRPGNLSLAHALWLLPLAILVVPPFVAIPVWSAGVDVAAPAAALGLPQPGPAPSAGATLPNWLEDHGREALVWLWMLGTASVLGRPPPRLGSAVPGGAARSACSRAGSSTAPISRTSPPSIRPSSRRRRRKSLASMAGETIRLRTNPGR